MYSEFTIGLRLSCLHTKVDFQGFFIGLCIIFWTISFLGLVVVLLAGSL